MLKIKLGSKFKTDLKTFKHDRSTFKNLDEVLKLLVNSQSLQEKYRDHVLSGKWNSARECYVKPDVLLIYRINKNTKEIELVTRISRVAASNFYLFVIN